MISVLAGERYSRLTVLDPDGPRRSGKRAARCRCVCGEVTLVQISHLIRGVVQSCGCQHADKTRAMGLANRTHGLSRAHLLYPTWSHMLARCEHPQHKNFKHYGGRGIRVCDRWHVAETFISDIERWLGPRPDGMTLDRIQNDHDYRLDNVRWATKVEQAVNRRKPVAA